MEKQKKTVRIPFYVEPETAKALDEVVTETGESRAAFIRRIIRDAIKEAAEQKPTEPVTV
jgi:metal-responsive CopG/Arc/MetJ family transcriptional regulator